jgi:protein TonB
VAAPNSSRRVASLLIGSLVVVAVVGLLVWAVHSLLQKPAKTQRQMTQIVKIVRPPPPPPDQPPPPPPPDKIDEPLPKDTPDEKPAEDAPQSEQLGLDAEGVAGGDGFGLAARKGGRDLLGGGAAFAWYTTIVKDSVLEVLSEDERIRRGSYSVTVKVWVSNDGRVENVKLASSSGNPQLDAAIASALGKLGKVREGPPLEMPQPVTLKIVSRG